VQKGGRATNNLLLQGLRYYKRLFIILFVKNQNTPPNCFKCTYFEITWDEKFPRACSVFNIKTNELPSVTVHRNTGHNCPAFKDSGKVK